MRTAALEIALVAWEAAKMRETTDAAEATKAAQGMVELISASTVEGIVHSVYKNREAPVSFYKEVLDRWQARADGFYDV